jgi:hypothetical protein
VFDLRPRLTATNGWMTDKPEGVAVLPDGRPFVVTDNERRRRVVRARRGFSPSGHMNRCFRSTTNHLNSRAADEPSQAPLRPRRLRSRGTNSSPLARPFLTAGHLPQHGVVD